MADQPEFHKQLESIERLLATMETTADPNLRAAARELVQAIMNLHGAAVERMLELIHGAGEGGAGIVLRLGRDELVGSLLALYGLHPLALEERVAQALEKLGPRLRARDIEVELLGIHDGAVRLRVSANGHSCGSDPDALRTTIEEAVYRSAPDVSSLVIEGAEVGQGFVKQGFVPIEMLKPAALTSAAAGKNGL